MVMMAEKAEKLEKAQERVLDISAMTVKERIVRISNELRITKEGRNTYSEYDYIRPNDIQEALKPLYLKYGVFTHFGMRKNNQGKNEGVLRVEDWNTDVGRQIYTMAVDDIQIKGANAAQNVGGLRTYCHKYLLMTAFNISSDEDDLDNDKNRGEDKAPKAAAKKDEPKTESADLIKLCQEKAKIDKNAVIGAIKKYHESGIIHNVKKPEDIRKLTEDLKKIAAKGGNGDVK